MAQSVEWCSLTRVIYSCHIHCIHLYHVTTIAVCTKFVEWLAWCHLLLISMFTAAVCWFLWLNTANCPILDQYSTIRSAIFLIAKISSNNQAAHRSLPNAIALCFHFPKTSTRTPTAVETIAVRLSSAHINMFTLHLTKNADSWAKPSQMEVQNKYFLNDNVMVYACWTLFGGFHRASRQRNAHYGIAVLSSNFMADNSVRFPPRPSHNWSVARFP